MSSGDDNYCLAQRENKGKSLWSQDCLVHFMEPSDKLHGAGSTCALQIWGNERAWK